MVELGFQGLTIPRIRAVAGQSLVRSQEQYTRLVLQDKKYFRIPGEVELKKGAVKHLFLLLFCLRLLLQYEGKASAGSQVDAQLIVAVQLHRGTLQVGADAVGIGAITVERAVVVRALRKE